MRKSDDKRAKDTGTVKNVLLGTAIGFAVIVILFAICAALISSGKMGNDIAAEIMLVSSFAGALVGSAVAAKRNNTQKIAIGLGVGGTIFAIKIILSAFGENGIFTSTTGVFLLCVLGGGICGSLLMRKKKKKRRA